MKPKTLIVILLLAIALGAAGIMLRRQDTSSWQQQASTAPGGKVLSFAINDVANVTIQSASEQVNLVNKGDLWRVQERDYPADFNRVSNLLQTLWDLKSVQDIEAGQSQYGHLQLLEPGKGAADGQGTLVDLKNAQGKRIAALMLGKNYMKQEGGMSGEGFAAGKYVLPLESGQGVSLVTETFADATTKPGDWLDHTFVQINGISAVTLTGTGAEMNWKLEQPSASGTWQLADAKPNEKLDATKVPAFANSFGNPTFVDIQAGDAKAANFSTTITVETTDGLTYVFKVGDLNADQYPVAVSVTQRVTGFPTHGVNEKPEDKKRIDDEFAAKKKQLEATVAKAKQFESRIFLVPKFTLDPILKDRASLLAVATPSPTPSTAPAPAQPPVSVTTPPVSLPPPTAPK